MPTAFAAVDLGATSGRVILGILDPTRPGADPTRHPAAEGAQDLPASASVQLIETARFPNGPVSDDEGGLTWDLYRLWDGILEGLREAGRLAAERGLQLSGIGVDSWAVDYALLGDDEHPVRPARCYRDPRFLPVSDDVYARVPAAEHYAINGLQHLPFTTEFQLVDDATRTDDGAFAAASTVLLVPDLITHWLTGERVAEVTNASTTGLLDARTREWSRELAARLAEHYPELERLPDLLPRTVEPGTVVGPLGPWAQESTGLGPVPVIAVASHDTASAVVGTPLPADGTAAFVSSGTWSLVGLELDAPVLTEASRLAGFTNELGLDGTVRYLRNVAGLWVLDECRRQWEREGNPEDLAALLDAAAAQPARRTVVDLDDPALLQPGDMPARLRAAAAAAGQPVPGTRAALARAVLDSLADAYARTVARAAELAGVTITQVNVVGGGSQNALLNQLTADAAGLPVVAGPVEAAALGNVLVQARAVGALPHDAGLADLRTVVAASTETHPFLPARTPETEPSCVS